MSALAGELAQAASTVARVAAGASLAVVPKQSPALTDLTRGTLRRYGRVQAIVRELSHRPRGDAVVEALLWCAIYALESGRYSDHAVVDQAVRACTPLERWTSKGYVNAVLRGYLRQRASLEARIMRDPEAHYQHPRWWIDLLMEAYPNDWRAVLDAGNSHPPMCLRVNRRRSDLAGYLARLQAAGLRARQIGEHALLLERAVPVERLPEFAQGHVSVQDLGAQRAVQCLDLSDGQRVLDACAAPGGKAGHILEDADVDLTALESDAKRVERLAANLARLGMRATILNQDCTQVAAWWDGRPFDRVLADVPCSASGIARRHPDVKWLRRRGDLEGFARSQGQILDALWRVLRPGGKLLYATCSVFPQENDAVIDAFVERSAAGGAQALRLPLADGGEAQWLPDAERDGFYYALIQKQH